MTTAQRERPILFSSEMVKAILVGRKTMTRRVVKGEARRWYGTISPYGKPGDRLWVKEALVKQASAYQPNGGVAYAADKLFVMGGPGFINEPDRMIGGPWPWKAKHLTGRYMPRWASRLTLEITDVRVERLQEIDPADACNEGWPGGEGCAQTPLEWFQSLWQSINGPESWNANPWVWVVSFNRVEAA